MQSLARNIGAGVLGWVAMFAGVFVLMAVFWMILGADGSFRPESWDVSAGWLLASVPIGLLAAVFGGIVCAKAAADAWGVRFLIVLVVALGVISAVLHEPAAVSGPRPDDVGMFEAMMSSQQPRWVAWLNPVIGVIGALLGARMVSGKAADEE